MELQHFSHSHPLIFNEDQQDEGDGEGVICSGCEEPISGPRYTCNTTACHFFLHKKCAELPLEIKQHSLHPEHPLLLLSNPPPQYPGYGLCDFCGTTWSHFVYHCSSCNFDLDIKCAFPPCFSESETQGHHQLNSILHSRHPHPLILKEEQEEYNDEGVICFGCGQPISGPHYRCIASNFFLHKRCAELPKKIKHHLHPEHPLVLETKPEYLSLCNLCYKICENFVYHCYSCIFKLDIKCAFPPCVSEAKIRQAQHQFVCLPKPIPLEWHSLTCNFCGNKGYGSPLLCTLCLLIFHEGCASLPETINIRQHRHRLTYTYFPEEDESGKPHCGVCHIQFNTGHGGFNCKECNFFAHVSCADEFETTALEIETRNNESVDSSITGTATEVEHPSHDHNLILIEEDGNDAKCAGCMLPISAPYYGCSPCNFVLHKACIELERNFEYRTLFSSEAIAAVFRCHLCRHYCNGFADKLFYCEQIIDIRCASKLSAEAITHESHEHTLFFTDRVYHSCNGCGRDSRFHFRCSTCQFSLDLRCVGLPLEARHRYEEHPLLLTYSDPNDYQFFCDVCEKKRDPKLWFYRCEECKFDAHIECVLREYHPYVQLGNTRMYDFHLHPLTLVEKIGDCIEDYPECHACGERCDELALECAATQCNYIIHGGGNRIGSRGNCCNRIEECGWHFG